MIKLILLIVICNQIASADTCIEGCLQCGSTDKKCTICDNTQMYLRNLISSKCEKVDIPNCVDISFTGDCLQCTSGFYPVSKQCQPIDAAKANSTPQCEIWDASQSCTRCSQNFFVDVGSCTQVVSLIPNCERHLSEVKCSFCKNGFQLSSDQTTCTAFPTLQNCMYLGDYFCEDCRTNFFLNHNSQFQDWQSSINEAKMEIYLTNTKNVLVDYLNQKQCQAVSLANCMTYSKYDECQVCDGNYYLTEKLTCKKNPVKVIPNCLKYLGNFVCNECQDGFFLKSNTICQAITTIDNCKSYLTTLSSTTKCVECIVNYYLAVSGQCVSRVNESIANCKTLSLTHDSCSECNNNYFGHSVNSVVSQYSLCKAVLPSCKTHRWDGTSVKCSACDDGKYLNQNVCNQGTLNFCNVYNQSSNSEQCSICNQKYYLSSQACLAHQDISNCVEFSENDKDECLYCDNGFFGLNVDKTCTKVYASITNCKVYIQNTNGNENNMTSTCETCDEGYYLENSTTCNIISNTTNPNCLQLAGTDLDVCERCKKGYGITQDAVGSSNQYCAMLPAFMTGGCDDKFIQVTGNFLVENQQCARCKDDHYTYDLEGHSACLENSLMVSLNKPFVVILNCAVYFYDSTVGSGSKYRCRSCTAGYYINSVAGETCILPTASQCKGQAAYNWNYYGTSFTVAHGAYCGDTDLVAIYGKSSKKFGNTSEKDDDNTFPLKCKENSPNDIITKYNDEFGYSNSPLTINGVLSKNELTKKNIQIICFQNTSSVKINGSTTAPIDPLCDMYYNDGGDDYYCKRCIKSQTGKSSGNEYYSDCADTITSSTKPVYNVKFEVLLLTATTSCINSTEIPFLFVNGSSNLAELTFTTADFVYDGQTGNTHESVQQCYNPIQIGNQIGRTVSTLLANCGFFKANIKDVDATTSPVFTCMFCKPGYKPNVGTITSCTPIANCDLTVEQNWADACSVCKDNYAWPVINDSDEIVLKFDECAKLTSDLPNNCVVVDSTNDICVMCDKGYYLTGDNTCTQLISPGCNQNNFTMEPKVPLTDSSSILGVQMKQLLQWTYQGISGCKQCQNSNSHGLFVDTSNLDIQQDYCIESDYVTEVNNMNTYPVGGTFIHKCKNYEGFGFKAAGIQDSRNLKCAVCEDNYILNTSKTICHQVTQVNLTNCTEAYNSGTANQGCNICEEGYGKFYQTGDQKFQCKGNDISNCKTIDHQNINSSSLTETQCTTCEPEYYLSNQNKSCLLGNVPNCMVLSDKDTCTTCNANFFKIPASDMSKNRVYQNVNNLGNQNRDYCMPIPADTLCATAEFTSSDKFNCVTCNTTQRIPQQDTNITVKNKCFVYNQINQCKSYFADQVGMKDATTISSKGVQQLDKGNFSCIECNVDYFRDELGYRCVPRLNRVANCESYDRHTDTCLSCYDQFFITDTQQCLPFPTGMEGCVAYIQKGLVIQCTLCQRSLYFMDSSNTCIKAEFSDANCAIIKNHSSCDVCQKGYYLISESSGSQSNQCGKANISSNCKTNVSSNDCSNCEAGYALVTTNNNKVCESLQDNLCEVWVGEKCVQCNYQTTNYPDNSSINGKCTPIIAGDVIDNCVYYSNNNTCKQCSEDYYLTVDGKSCKTVSGSWDNGCGQQNQKNTLVCSLCLPGYQLVNGTCQEMSGAHGFSQGCLLPKLNDGTCLACRTGWYMNNTMKCVEIFVSPVTTIVVKGVSVLKIALGVVLLLLEL